MVYQPSSPLTMTSAKNALAEGLRAIESGTNHINLSLITATDSAAVAILLAWQRAAQRRGMALTFHNAPSAVRSLAKLYGVHDLLSFSADAHQSVEPARH